MRKLLLIFAFVIAGILLVGSVRASDLEIPIRTSLFDSFGTFKIGNNISVVQSCTNSTSFCDYCNLTSLKYPDGSIIGANIIMSKSASLFNYTLDGAYTEIIGRYTVTGFCQSGGEYSPFTYNFDMTFNGKDYPSDFVTVFFLIMFILTVMFSLYFSIYTLAHLLRLDFDLIDLSYALGIYFGIVALYYLQYYYMGNEGMDSWLLLIIQGGGILLVMVPIVAFILSITIGTLKNNGTMKMRIPKRFNL